MFSALSDEVSEFFIYILVLFLFSVNLVFMFGDGSEFSVCLSFGFVFN